MGYKRKTYPNGKQAALLNSDAAQEKLIVLSRNWLVSRMEDSKVKAATKDKIALQVVKAQMASNIDLNHSGNVGVSITGLMKKAGSSRGIS